MSVSEFKQLLYFYQPSFLSENLFLVLQIFDFFFFLFFNSWKKNWIKKRMNTRPICRKCKYNLKGNSNSFTVLMISWRYYFFIVLLHALIILLLFPCFSWEAAVFLLCYIFKGCMTPLPQIAIFLSILSLRSNNILNK